ncbi:HET-domain-containing protein, partial [Dothidotthia symphoricarpi CBS 119687]
MLSKIQSWIASCVATHHDCTIFNKSIPKRLIKLDGDACLRSPETPVRYAALSYCWGSFKQPTTTKANVAIRYNHLNISNLPQTLKDAVVMTRKLGIDYLWIDSICIVQDDEDDWATESAKMGDLYSNAYVVLAATGAIVNNHGFIEQTRLSQFPLFKRGWTMQERLLATRTVHFLPDEVLYECKTSTRCECGTKNDSTLNQITWPPKEKPHNPRWSHELEFSREWANIVSDYSKRHLTYANDVLPALSGIARRTLSIQPGKYIAGMWEKGIAFQLSWHTTEPTKD